MYNPHFSTACSFQTSKNLLVVNFPFTLIVDSTRSKTHENSNQRTTQSFTNLQQFALGNGNFKSMQLKYKLHSHSTICEMKTKYIKSVFEEDEINWVFNSMKKLYRLSANQKSYWKSYKMFQKFLFHFQFLSDLLFDN